MPGLSIINRLNISLILSLKKHLLCLSRFLHLFTVDIPRILFTIIGLHLNMFESIIIALFFRFNTRFTDLIQLYQAPVMTLITQVASAMTLLPCTWIQVQRS